MLARHRGEMMAVALAVLGRSAEAEDAVQDAMFLALSRIKDLRDPGAVGPWLKTIVRNCCRMQLRTRTPVPIGGLADESLRGSESDPSQTLERHAARDWVWHAMEQLSPPLRLVTMLRYFTDAMTYEQIAAMCGVPVGTVRSRLSTARAKLSQELLTGASSPHQDMTALTAARWQEAEQTLS
ncbi:RNA polymerase sigma factor, partial [Frankia sp. ACN1ag]|uniref:RNA polymerase sigma factor n=1 Tax=Frankia sp. ACN1ag TaxID=102891 RepID=UPI0037BF1524